MAEVIKVLTEFNKWRRGEPPYEWDEDPYKENYIPYSATEVGIAIEEAINMLKHPDMIEREKRDEEENEND